MLILGAEYLASLLDGISFSAKMVFNANGAIIFPVSREHRDVKGEGISYQDNYKGNALAAMLSPGRIDVRFHKGFSDRDVERIVCHLLLQPELAMMAGWRCTYQGRVLKATS